MKKITLLLILGCFLPPWSYAHASEISSRLKGRILLQVEQSGQGWYVQPDTEERIYMGSPESMYDVMRYQGLGISNTDLEKIPIKVPLDEKYKLHFQDTDHDDVPDEYEALIGTDPNRMDTDGDGFPDGVELNARYNPLGPGRSLIDQGLIDRVAGKILLQVEGRGEAWYVDPQTGTRSYLPDPIRAFYFTKFTGLGISDVDIAKIPIARDQYEYDGQVFPDDWGGMILGDDQSTVPAKRSCDANDLECLAQAAENCNAADVLNTVTLDIFGVEQTATSYLQITGGTKDSCNLYIRTEDVILKFPSGTDQTIIDDQNKLYHDHIIGRDGNCSFHSVDLASLLRRWIIGDFSTDDFDVADCSGEYFNPIIDDDSSQSGQSSVYSDSVYNFELEFPASWDGYDVIFDQATSDPYAEEYIQFGFPMATGLLTISIHTHDHWNQLLSFDSPRPAYLGESDEHVFGYITNRQDLPTQFVQERSVEVDSIANTFRLKN